MNPAVSRRQYWSRQMDEALVFLREALRYPVEECGEALVPLQDAMAKARVKVCFSELPFPGGIKRLFLLREGLVSDFMAIAREMNEQDFVIKVEDAFRTPSMQRSLSLSTDVLQHVVEMVKWETERGEPTPEQISARLKVLVAWFPKTAGHMSGSAVDISVLEINTCRELDRGGAYLELSEKTPMDSPFIPDRCRRNRGMINEIFSHHGFRPYPFEFWHYSSGDSLAELVNASDSPARYGPVDFDSASGRIHPNPHLLEALISVEELGSNQ